MTAKIYQFRKKAEPVADAPAQAPGGAQDRLRNAMSVVSAPPPGETTSVTWMLQFKDRFFEDWERLGLPEETKAMFDELTSFLVTETTTRIDVKGLRTDKDWPVFMQITCEENGNPDAAPVNLTWEQIVQRFMGYAHSWRATQPSDPVFQFAALGFAIDNFYRQGYMLMSWRIPPVYTPGSHIQLIFVHPKQLNVKYSIAAVVDALDLTDLVKELPIA